MADRDLPYSQFNFLVNLGDGDTDSSKAGFQEVSGLGVEVTIAEYRSGNHKENSTRKIPGTYKATDVTFKRGLANWENLFKWTQRVREGKQDIREKVVITLLSEDRQPAMEWELVDAFPMKWVGPSFNGKGTDVIVEELTMACERIDMKVL